jgi:hypothetical protein
VISREQYFGAKPHDAEHDIMADDLLVRINELLDEAFRSGIQRRIDPDTGTEISGSKGGSGDGGFRLPTASTGSPNSSHKQAKAVDVFDPDESLEDWIDDEILERHGLYRESPADTVGWVHLSTRAPGSGKRTFKA